MSEPVVLVEKEDGVATVTLNRPEALNALSRELRGALARTFAELREDSSVRVAILTGAGRAFCAGVDLKELGGEAGAQEGEALDGVSNVDVVGAMERCEFPIIGAVNGFAITGGFELALACDVLIASTEARFADTHARVGILPGWGLSQKLSRAIGIYRAKEISLTGNFLAAETAERWGLVSRVVSSQELLPTCRQLAQDMLSCDPASLRGYKKVIDDGFATSFADGMNLEAKTAREHSRGVTPEAIAERRREIQQRGRRQSGA